MSAARRKREGIEIGKGDTEVLYLKRKRFPTIREKFTIMESLPGRLHMVLWLHNRRRPSKAGIDTCAECLVSLLAVRALPIGYVEGGNHPVAFL